MNIFVIEGYSINKCSDLKGFEAFFARIEMIQRCTNSEQRTILIKTYQEVKKNLKSSIKIGKRLLKEEKKNHLGRILKRMNCAQRI
ncbi:hypothetical protein V1478_005122 [Vespula squamosa]|uniref:Uncharacterized protein n=1 Tax=Vespula squamosa TaxID=30214 RepID=A0ABD2BDE6_VESSQ